MNSEKLKQALQETRDEQHKNRQIELKNEQLAYEKCPALVQLVNDRRNLIRESVISALSGGVPENIEIRMDELNRSINKELRAAGLPENQFEAVYTCELCADTGYVGRHKKELCKCVLTRYRKLLTESYSMGDSHETFENYDEKVFSDELIPGSRASQRSYMNVVRNTCEQYADLLPRPAVKNILFYGKSGLGKTYLLNSIAMRAKERGVAYISITANSLLNRIRKAYFSSEETELNAIYNVPLLLIDDLGTEPLWENITVEQLFALINDRFSKGKCTIISTNLMLTELQQRYTERISSRLLDPRLCKTIQFIGNDIRKRAL